MSRRRPSPTTSDSRQTLLDFGLYQMPSPPPALPGSLSCAAQVCGLVSYALDQARQVRGLSRAMVAARMSELCGERVSEAMLNATTAESHEAHRFPLQWLPALVEATGCTEALTSLAERMGALVLIGREAMDARLGQIDRQMEMLRGEKARLKREVRHA